MPAARLALRRSFYACLEIEQRQPVELFESTLAIPRQSQVLSLVWVVAEGE